ncbi:hypothetical protein DDB_G0269756 [Dictyostelium discoideum AX4]|uniref:Enoyl-CoA hydratase/isomerase domain-containing protein n=1 Tax=Dictyostelium discoideum TaxID=44689 RepID=Q55D79_DICDI|nr:hypothetical protein DDB_G0269756 [Dictyostelium discoideum AX4]EAL72228.1 hypothetical protein DDB_G0269756 [Dictyostelium discoideum AX4]|eukprot:XP_646252.1 hypothetical protein DDB_G0269756 [Dictyostelium discoideum AX4]
MLGLRKISNCGNKTYISRSYATIVKRKASKSGLDFGKKIDFKNLEKVEPIQPKPFVPTSTPPTNDKRLTNIESNKKSEEKFYYSPNFSKLGVLANVNELNENWGHFKGDTNEKGVETGSSFTLSTKSKIEMGKNSSGFSVPFPRISGQGAPIVCVPSTFGQTYSRGMLNNRDTLNALDMMTMGEVEHFIKYQIANEVVSAYSIHTTTPGVIQCGGLDFVKLYQSKNDTKFLSEYFKKVSKMFYLMSVAPKPQVSIIDGLTIGAGVGFTANSGFRIGSENSILTIPDCAVGFFPNAGNIRFLNRLDGGVGLYLALTGRRVRGAELIQCGLVDFLIPTNMIPTLDDQLSRLPLKNHERLIANIATFSVPAETQLDGRETHLDIYRDAIKRCFENKTTIEQVIEALENESDKTYDWAQRCIKNINKSSPISIKLTMRLFNESPTDLSSNEYFERDYNISMALVNDSESDLWEGIRANLIDSREPIWRHKSYTEVDDKLIDDIINYKPPTAESVLKLTPFKSTYLMFEDVLNEYFNLNQFTLSGEVRSVFEAHTGNPFTKDYDDAIEIFFKGARSDKYQIDRNSASILTEMSEIDMATL